MWISVLVLREIFVKSTLESADMRIFSDEEGKINRSIEDVGGEVLVVSQFTLYADCKKGNRPSFTNAGSPAEAERLYEYFLEECRKEFGKVEHGIFGAEMKVSLENDVTKQNCFAAPYFVTLEK